MVMPKVVEEVPPIIDMAYVDTFLPFYATLLDSSFDSWTVQKDR